MLSSQLIECHHILQAVVDSRENKRGVAGVFMALPDKKLFPDYYQVIPEPICLNMISNRLKKNQYKTPEDFLRDMQLVFLNAQFYNKEKSGIHKDSIMLEKLVFYIYRQFILKGTLPEVIDDGLRTTMNAPRTKGRPAKNPLIENYKNLHPDIAAIEPPKKPAVTPRVNVPSGTAPSVTAPSASQPVVAGPSTGDHLTTPVSTYPTVLQSAQSPVNKQTASPGVVPTPQRISHAVGTARLVAPPIPATFPEVVIPERIPGLDEQDFAAIAEHARIREEADKTLEKWTGPAENLPVDPKDEGNKILGSGWWGDEHNGTVDSWQQRAVQIVDKLRAYVDIDGTRPCATVEQVPVASSIPYLSFQHPLSLQSIVTNLMGGVYPTMKAFDMEMSRLFEKARRFYPRGTAPYGAVLTSQRMYNALTSLHEVRELPQGVPPASPVAFASIPAGPGNAKPMSDNGTRGSDPREFTGSRVATKDRVFTSMAKYKGMTYRMGDYVHLANPDDPSRPIPAQVYRSFIPTQQPPRHMITVCWYFRPEQTVHQPTQLFHEDEIFKTGHMVDHPVEDIIERVGCQFFTKYVRGRPLNGEWYPGWPLYVCVSRYNEKERLTVRIKNWGSCIPEELRKSDFMQVTTFDKAPHTLLSLKSPFLRGTRPGTPGVTGYLSNDVGQTANEKRGAQDEALSDNEEGGPESTTPNASAGRPVKKARTEERSPLATASNLPAPAPAGLTVFNGEIPAFTSVSRLVSGSQATPTATVQPTTTHSHLSGFTASPATRPPQQPQPSPFTGSHSIVPLNRSNPSTYAHSHQLPPGAQGLQYPMRPLDPSAPVPGPPRPLGYMQGSSYTLNTQPIRPISNTQHQYNYPGSVQQARPPHTPMPGQVQSGNAQQNQTADGRSASQPGPSSRSKVADRTIANLYGSVQEMERLCETEVLPETTINMLDRDPSTNRVLWFSGPPIDIIVPEKPKHSAAYLAFLAKKRLQHSLAESDNEKADGMQRRDANGSISEGDKGAWASIERDVKKLLQGE